MSRKFTRRSLEYMDYAGLRVTIMGLGRFSGGVGAARFFATRGARVTVTDLEPEETLRPSVEALRGLPIRFVLGAHRDEDILAADLVVVNPAIKEDSPYLNLARAHGIALTTEINLVFERCPALLAGVTGTNGKTTTTQLLGAMFQAHDPRALVGGNIGRSILNEVETTPADTFVTLELSSFQLKRLGWIARSPQVSVVTNVSPNHLDWHGTLDDYLASKYRILASQAPDDIAVLNAEDRVTAGWAAGCRGRVFRFSVERPVARGAYVRDRTVVFRAGGREEEICAVARLRIPGRHNLANVLAAVAAARTCGVPVPVVRSVVTRFSGVAHRLEFVTELEGVRYYDDSASTTPESTITALCAFDAPILLIAGGYDKGAAFDAMAETAVRCAKAVLLIGDTAEKIEAAIHARRGGAGPVLCRCASMEEGLERCRNLARPGDVVVLSPGCASYDMFVNFEDRGDRFKALVTGKKG